MDDTQQPGTGDTAEAPDAGEGAIGLDELHTRWREALNTTRRVLELTSREVRQQQFDATELGLTAMSIAEQGRQATENGDAAAAAAALERQRDVLSRVEENSVELRVLLPLEEKLRRRFLALQSAVDDLRIAKESAKGELAMARADRAFDLAESDAEADSATATSNVTATPNVTATGVDPNIATATDVDVPTPDEPSAES